MMKRIVFGLIAAGFLASCSFDINRVPVRTGPDMAPADLPTPIVGESYAFDDGRFDTVVAVDGAKVVWRNRKRHRDHPLSELRRPQTWDGRPRRAPRC